MIYEWDPNKAAANFADRGVNFEDAEDFEWDVAHGWIDDRQDYNEVREVAVAPIRGRIHVMVFTMRCNRIRIISLRKANSREIVAYEQLLDR